MVAAVNLRERVYRPRAAPTGITSTRLYNGQIHDLDQNAEVRGDRWIGGPDRIGIADKMIRDPVVKRSHNSVVDTLVGAFWDVDAASDDPVDVEIADFVEWNLFEQLAWELFIERACSYLRYGFSLHELTTDVRRIPSRRFPLLAAHGRGRAVIATDLHHRPSPSIYEWDARRENAAQVGRVLQWSAGGDTEEPGEHEIPGEWLLRITWEQEGGNFQGYPPARPQYGPWKAKTLCQVLEMITHERFAVPTPVITLPDGQELNVAEDEVAEAEKIARDFRSNERGYAVLPGGYKLDATTIDDDIDRTIKRANQEIMLPFGGGYELLGNNSSGSHALAGTQKSVQNVTIERHAAVIGTAVNRGFDGWSLIERIVRPNYGPDVSLPLFRCRALPTREWSEIFKSIRNLGEIGFLTPGRKTERFIRWVSTLPQESMPYVAEGFRARMGISPQAADPKETT